MLQRTFCLFVLVLVTSLTLSSTAAADDQPLMMPINGFLTDTDGVVIDGPVDMTFSLYADATTDDSFWSETLPVDVDQGVFHDYLGSTEQLQTQHLKDHPGAYVAVAIDGDDEMERWPLGDVPYAAVANFAHDAATVGGLTPDELALQGADDLPFDDGATNLDATNTQQAIEVLVQRIDQLESQVTDHDTALDNITDDLSDQASSVAAVEDDLVSTQSDVASIQSDVSGNQSQISSLQSDVSDNQSQLASLQSDVSGNQSQLSSLDDDFSSLQSQVDDIDVPSNVGDRLDDLETLTAPMSRMTVAGEDSLVVEDVNLHVRSGAGATDATVNGRGNLIVGYDEVGGSSDKSGSHNIVFGRGNSYTSYGGLVGGTNNDVHGNYSSVLAGSSNEVTGSRSAIVSGSSNTVESDRSAIVSGSSGTVDSNTAAILAGYNNEASGTWSAIVAGSNNTTTGMDSVVVGGSNNEATGSQEVVVD